MRNSDIETIEKVVTALEDHLPCGKMALLTEFSELYVRFKSQNDKQKQGYQDKAQYYRDSVMKWKSENPDKQKQYSREYAARKKKAKDKPD